MTRIIGRGRYARETYPVRSNRIVSSGTDLTLIWSFTTGAAQMGPNFVGRIVGTGQSDFVMPRAGVLTFAQLGNYDPVGDGLPAPIQIRRNGSPIVIFFPTLANTWPQWIAPVQLAAADVLTMIAGGGAVYNTHTFSALAVLNFE